MKVMMGNRELTMGSRYLTELRSSNDILDNVELLRARLQEDGYLLIRGLHDRGRVMAARQDFLSSLQAMQRLQPGSKLEDGVIGVENKNAIWGKSGFELQEQFPNFVELVSSQPLIDFFSKLLGGPAITYDYKWPRAVASGGNTGAHYDIVYMGRGTKQVYTLWTPLGDTSYELGTLAMLLGSQHFDILKRTYGEMDVDRDNLVSGWFSEDPIELVDQYGGQWATTEFQAGDVLIFGMYMMHASLNNTTNRYRLSSDTRYQLASEPVDDRWMGVRPKGHTALGSATAKTIQQVRAEQGI